MWPHASDQHISAAYHQTIISITAKDVWYTVKYIP